MSVTVITGGAGGIGRACAERLRERGPVLTADIAGADVVCDVTDLASVALVAERAAELGPLGALVHTAGPRTADAGGPAPGAGGQPGRHRARARRVPAAGGSRDGGGMHRVAGRAPGLRGRVRRPVRGPARSRAIRPAADARRRARHLLAVQARRDGRVRRRAAEWGARGARIVSVSPGLVVDTAIGQAAATIHAGAYAQLSALGRAGMAADIAGVVAFLTSRMPRTSPAATCWSTAAWSRTR